MSDIVVASLTTLKPSNQSFKDGMICQQTSTVPKDLE